MICLLHGYLLEGSGSNLWTRAIVEALCRSGTPVHLMAQENHPERYPFIHAAHYYHPDGRVESWTNPTPRYEAACVLHRPALGDTLPVYVWDRYEEFGNVVPMVDLDDAEIVDYLDRNFRVLKRVVQENGITALHANHAVLMSVVAQQLRAELGIPYTIMPHGSALEFVLKRDARYVSLAAPAFEQASRIFVHGEEMRSRVRAVLPMVNLEPKLSDLHLGVDTCQFQLVSREQRAATIAALLSSIAGLPRGRTREQTRALERALEALPDATGLAAAIQGAPRYDTKTPDADLEQKLNGVDWANAPTLLFVGRILASKGIHSIIAALPLLLEAVPGLRLFVVGHGPLREPLEAFLWALRNGRRDLARHIAQAGRELEGTPEGNAQDNGLTEMVRFLEGLDADAADRYFANAERLLREDTVLFTGYLVHEQLRLLFPCCDVSVFPSVVREAGPLVFLEALASGSFPVGTDFGGMRASIDSISDVVPAEVSATMRVSPDPALTVRDIVERVPRAFEMSAAYKHELASAVRARYDWGSVAQKLKDELQAL